MVDRWCRLRDVLESGRVVAGTGPGPLESSLAGFTEAISDDLNLAKAIGVLNEAVNASRSEDAELVSDEIRAASELSALTRMDSVLGVLDRNETLAAEGDDLASTVESQIEARAAAKAAKDWAAADAIRDELAAMGIAIKDGPEGTTWARIVE